jgi:hypothetical protein
MKSMTMAIAAALIFPLATSTLAAETASGNSLDKDRSTISCLCGRDADGSASRCFVDTLCEDRADCQSDGECPAGQMCLDENSCCGERKCVETCSSKTCTVAAGHGVCLAYDACTSGDGGCGFNSAPASGVRALMVRSYAACPGINYPTANTETSSDTDACAPVVPSGDSGSQTFYSYGLKGKCDFRTRASVLTDCAGLTAADGTSLNLPSGGCHLTKVTVACSGITRSDGHSLIDGPADSGWTLSMLWRITINDANGPMTLGDIPVTFGFSTPVGGGMGVNSNSAVALAPLIGDDAALPPCTSIEFDKVTIKDPDGRPFAAVGAGATAPRF